MAALTFADLLGQFESRGLAGRHLTAKQGAFLYSLWSQETRIPVQSRAKDGRKFVEDILPDGRRVRFWEEWNKSWALVIE